METHDAAPFDRIRSLERRLRMTQGAALAAFLCLAGLSAGGSAEQDPDVIDRLRARRIDVIDDQGVVRISMGQDPATTHRRSRACGITFHDPKGDERGGMGTMEDLSAVIALDAPRGVGGSMPDRIGMMVSPDGSAQLVLIDNQMQAAARLVSEATGGGALELYSYDLDKGEGMLKRMTCAGEKASQFPLDDGK